MEKVVRCDDLFTTALKHFTSKREVKKSKPMQLYIAGFINGLCEKVYLGACNAAMIRPPYKEGIWILSIAGKIATIYNLDVCSFRNDDKIEIWFLRNRAAKRKLDKARQSWRSKHELNRLRGELCGIPRREINPSYPWKFQTLEQALKG